MCIRDRFFPIPLFGLGFCALYLLFIDWDWLFSKFRGEKVVTRFDFEWLPRPKVYQLLWIIPILSLVSQNIIIAARYTARTHPFRAVVADWNRKYIARPMGLVSHGVYVDWHFRVKSPIMRFLTVIDGETVEIPSFSEDSYLHYPASTGRFFVYHLFVMRSDKHSFRRLQGRWGGYLTRWFLMKGIEPRDVEVRHHRIDPKIEMDFTKDDRIESEGFTASGTMVYRKGKFFGQWTEQFIKDMTETRRGYKPPPVDK